jgi:hypothetical protein
VRKHLHVGALLASALLSGCVVAPKKEKPLPGFTFLGTNAEGYLEHTHCRSAHRLPLSPRFRGFNVGFRPARPLP